MSRPIVSVLTPLMKKRAAPSWALAPGGLIRPQIAWAVGVPVGLHWMFSERTIRLSISIR